jgi:hypothetical protein
MVPPDDLVVEDRDLAAGGLQVGVYQQRAPTWMEVGRTTDQLRTTTAQLSASQRSTVHTSDKWSTLYDRESPIWGSRGREFKSRQPD